MKDRRIGYKEVMKVFVTVLLTIGFPLFVGSTIDLTHPLKLDVEKINQSMKEEILHRIEQMIKGRREGSGFIPDYITQQAYNQIKERLKKELNDGKDIYEYLNQLVNKPSTDLSVKKFQQLVADFTFGMRTEIVTTLEDIFDEALLMVEKLERLNRITARHPSVTPPVLYDFMKELDIPASILNAIDRIEKNWNKANKQKDNFDIYKILRNSLTGKPHDQSLSLVFSLGEKYKDKAPFIANFTDQYIEIIKRFLYAAYKTKSFLIIANQGKNESSFQPVKGTTVIPSGLGYVYINTANSDILYFWDMKSNSFLKGGPKQGGIKALIDLRLWLLKMKQTDILRDNARLVKLYCAYPGGFTTLQKDCQTIITGIGVKLKHLEWLENWSSEHYSNLLEKEAGLKQGFLKKMEKRELLDEMIKSLLIKPSLFTFHQTDQIHKYLNRLNPILLQGTIKEANGHVSKRCKGASIITKTIGATIFEKNPRSSRKNGSFCVTLLVKTEPVLLEMWAISKLSVTTRLSIQLKLGKKNGAAMVFKGYELKFPKK